jgi:hypothetical protein
MYKELLQMFSPSYDLSAKELQWSKQTQDNIMNKDQLLLLAVYGNEAEEQPVKYGC